MNRVKNPGKHSRLQSKELTDLRLQLAGVREAMKKMEAAAKTAAQEVETLKVALAVKDRLRDGNLTVSQAERGLRFTVEVEVRPRAYRIDGRDLGIQYSTAQIALRHATERALQNVHEVCGDLSTLSKVTVEELPPVK